MLKLRFYRRYTYMPYYSLQSWFLKISSYFKSQFIQDNKWIPSCISWTVSQALLHRTWETNMFQQEGMIFSHIDQLQSLVRKITDGFVVLSYKPFHRFRCDSILYIIVLVEYQFCSICPNTFCILLKFRLQYDRKLSPQSERKRTPLWIMYILLHYEAKLFNFVCKFRDVWLSIYLIILGWCIDKIH
jgi:hypothetical protein